MQCLEDSWFLLSELCTNGSATPQDECVMGLDVDLTKRPIRYLTGSWYVLIGITGGIGNLVTFICVIFATRRNKFGFDNNVETTIFILNLSAIEFCYCVFYALPQSTSYIFNYWIFNLPSCQFCYLMGNVLNCANRLAIACIAVSRCLELTKNKFWLKWSQERSILYTIVVSTWLFGMVGSEVMLGFESLSHVGWGCEIGGCTLIPRAFQSPYYIISYSFGIIVDVVCYLVMWRKVRKSTENVKQLGNVFPRNLQDRQRKLTKVILFLVLSDVICNSPEILLLPFDVPPNVLYFSFILYNLQYAMNVFIYAVSNSQYRQAYIYAWKCLITNQKTTEPTSFVLKNREVHPKTLCVLENIQWHHPIDDAINIT